MDKLSKQCCFIGHRKIEKTDKLINDLKSLIIDLITNKGVSTFLFGSNSAFDNLCLEIVSNLKNTYAHIKRVQYTCPHEGCFLLEDKIEWEKYNLEHNIDKEYKVWFEEEHHYKNKYSAGKASYVERNQALIKDSDYCIFYYNKDYLPPKRKHSKKCVNEYQPKSGTKLAYEFAKQKNKKIFNIHK